MNFSDDGSSILQVLICFFFIAFSLLTPHLISIIGVASTTPMSSKNSTVTYTLVGFSQI